MPANSEQILDSSRSGTLRFLLSFALLLTILALSLPVFSEEYIIGEGDLLKISVYDNPDLATDSRVSGDGKITLPLIGEVTVTGMTAATAQKLIADKLLDGYIRKPQVTVFITEYKSKKVTTLGEFTKPGLIELRGNSTLMEVISNAGGITVNASENLVIKRKVLKPGGLAEDLSIDVDLNRLLEKGDISTNIMVKDGDSIYIPRAAFIYVTGEVKTPGAYKVTKGLTVLRSITLAGGFTQKAAKNSTSIVRKSDSGERSLAARMEDLVRPDDIIVVPESFF
jgi:polysaccharide export outer membrane protein